MTAPNARIDIQTARPVSIGGGRKLAFIAGPCQMESRQHALETAHALKEIAQRQGIGLVYKTSFDKANRTSVSTARGIGLADALPIFAEIRESVGLPVITDVHEIDQCAQAAQVVDGVDRQHQRPVVGQDGLGARPIPMIGDVLRFRTPWG